MLAHLLAMAQDPHGRDILASLVISHALVALTTGIVVGLRAFRRGKEVQAMELPQRGGAFHIHDGPSILTEAPSASAAISKLLAGTPQAHRPSLSRQWD